MCLLAQRRQDKGVAVSYITRADPKSAQSLDFDPVLEKTLEITHSRLCRSTAREDRIQNGL